MCDVIDPDHSQRYSIDLKQSSFDHLPDRIFYLLFQIVRTIQTILTFFSVGTIQLILTKKSTLAKYWNRTNRTNRTTKMRSQFVHLQSCQSNCEQTRSTTNINNIARATIRYLATTPLLPVSLENHRLSLLLSAVSSI